jgi:hypothetical protein
LPPDASIANRARNTRGSSNSKLHRCLLRRKAGRAKKHAPQRPTAKAAHTRKVRRCARRGRHQCRLPSRMRGTQSLQACHHRCRASFSANHDNHDKQTQPTTRERPTDVVQRRTDCLDDDDWKTRRKADGHQGKGRNNGAFGRPFFWLGTRVWNMLNWAFYNHLLIEMRIFKGFLHLI